MRSPFRAGDRAALRWLPSGIIALGLCGCASTMYPVPDTSTPGTSKAVARKSDDSITLVANQESAGKPASSSAKATLAAESASGPVTVDDFVQLAVSQNPRITRATFAIDQAKGWFVQAGLYPNPVLAVTGDELGDRTGPGGIWTAPQFTQEIVLGRKLSLSQAVAATEVDQSSLAVLRERYAVVGTVRAAFYDLYALERRITVLDELAKLAGDAVRNGQTLLVNQQIARLDLVQLEVELARFRSQAEASRRELPAARARLAAVVGDPRLSITGIAGPFENIPHYDDATTLATVLACHPELRTARVGIERAQAAIRRAEAEPIPNLTLSTGYVRQNQNRSDDWVLGVSAPIPLWNRNQGNIRAAKAELGMAIQEVAKVENDLAERVAVAQRSYSAAFKMAEQYRNEILPKAEETNRLSMDAFKGGQFEYLRVIQSQRAVAESRLEYNRALGDAWKAAAELSALLLEEMWPGPTPKSVTQTFLLGLKSTPAELAQSRRD